MAVQEKKQGLKALYLEGAKVASPRRSKKGAAWKEQAMPPGNKQKMSRRRGRN
jgi:hypothetical protein